jgi:hypothetical protein
LGDTRSTKKNFQKIKITFFGNLCNVRPKKGNFDFRNFFVEWISPKKEMIDKARDLADLKII